MTIIVDTSTANTPRTNDISNSTWSDGATVRLEPTDGASALRRRWAKSVGGETTTRREDRLHAPTTDPGQSDNPDDPLAMYRASSDGAQPRRPSTPGTFAVAGLRSWTGVIKAVDDEFFSAELQESEFASPVMAEFALDVLGADADVQVGDVVYLTVRKVKGRGGPSTTTTLRRRRLGRWSDAEIDEMRTAAEAQAHAFSALFGE